MFDSRIAIEERTNDLTDSELQEMNEYHERMDREWRDRCEMADMISDLSKDVQGFRHRFDWASMPMNDLVELYNEWIVRHSEHMIDELEDAHYDSIVECEDSTPDEWDDLYDEMGW